MSILMARMLKKFGPWRERNARTVSETSYGIAPNESKARFATSGGKGA
jgi:hypothetical protein